MEQNQTADQNSGSLDALVRQLRDEADLCRNETATDIAELLDAAAKELDGLALMKAGREQDQRELKRCISTLDGIATDYTWMTRKDMVNRATAALLDVGAWVNTKPKAPNAPNAFTA